MKVLTSSLSLVRTWLTCHQSVVFSLNASKLQSWFLNSLKQLYTRWRHVWKQIISFLTNNSVCVIAGQISCPLLIFVSASIRVRWVRTTCFTNKNKAFDTSNFIIASIDLVNHSRLTEIISNNKTYRLSKSVPFRLETRSCMPSHKPLLTVSLWVVLKII